MVQVRTLFASFLRVPSGLRFYAVSFLWWDIQTVDRHEERAVLDFPTRLPPVNLNMLPNFH